MVRREVVAMLGFLNDIHPLILDVAFVSIIVLATSLGAIRGIKNVGINTILFSASLFLGFSPYVDSLKKVLADKLLNVDNLAPAGSTEVFKFIVSLFIPLFSALILFLLFYVVLFVLRVLIEIIVKKKIGGYKNPKSKVGRVFAGLISLVYSTALLLLVLTAANTNMIGMTKPIENSTVVKFGVETTDKLFDKIEDKFEEKLFIKILAGDILKSVEDKSVDAFVYFDEKVISVAKNKDYFEEISLALTVEEGHSLAKEKINDLYELSKLANDLMGSGNTIQTEYVSLAEAGLTSINRLVKSKNLGQLEYSINDYTSIRKSFENIGVREDVLKFLDEITIRN